MAPLPQGVQPVRTNRGQEYGAAKAQAEAQAAQPLPTSTATAPNLSQLPGGGRAGDASQRVPVGPEPGSLPRLSDPTARPNEPITAGMPMGPGPGPEALTAQSFGPEELSVLRGVFLQYPNEDLRRLIEWTESNLA